jgi:hypothetical protein
LGDFRPNADQNDFSAKQASCPDDLEQFLRNVGIDDGNTSNI